MRYLIYLLAGFACGLCSATDWVITDESPPHRVIVEQVDNAPVAPVIDKPFFIFFTAGPRCGPCIRWEANEMPKVLKAGYGVQTVDINNAGDWSGWVRYYGINTGPRFFLVDRKDMKAVKDRGPWIGFTSAITLIQAAEGKGILAPADRSEKVARLTCPEIRALVRSRYSPGRSLNADVSPQSMVWDHLTDGSGGTHTFSPDQVSCLSLWEALCLHDDAHEGRFIRPE